MWSRHVEKERSAKFESFLVVVLTAVGHSSFAVA